MKDTKINPIEIHDSICQRIHNLYVKKNSDYGNSASDLYDEFGDIAYMIRITDKYNRLKSLLNNNAKQLVADESINDTIMDLANYCLIWLMDRERTTVKDS